MKRESSIIHTKENSVKKENYLIKKEEQHLMRLDKAANVLSVIVKVEMVITLVLMTFYAILNGFPIM